MTDTLSIYKGDTAGPWNVGVTGDDGALVTITPPWTCKIKVAGTAIDRAVSDRTVDNKRFIAALTPAETDTLEVGLYVVAVEIENTTTTPPMRREHHIVLTVEKHVVGTTDVPAASETEIERLTREISELKTQRINVASGNAVIDVWREGRRIRKHVSTIDELNSLIRLLEGELVSAQVAAGVTPTTRRRPIALVWNN
jgi:hypothetical protein